MTDDEITAIVGWPTEPEMLKYRKIASAAEAAERERIVNALPGGYSVDPQWVADMVRDGPACGKPDTSELLT